MKEQNTGEVNGLFLKIENAIELINKTISSKEKDIDFLKGEAYRLGGETACFLLKRIMDERENILILKRIKEELE